ncbi:MAG: hypothetical protein AAGG75_11905 [Bacteroidota bacterium]
MIAVQMSEELLRTQIRQLITAGRSRKAAELLCAFLGGTTSVLYNPALDQLSRINRLEQGVNKGRIDEMEADYELAQINQSLLSIADKVLLQAKGESIDLDQKNANDVQTKKKEDKSTRNTRLIGFISLIITAWLTYYTYRTGTPSVFELRVKLEAPEGHEEQIRQGQVKLILDEEYRLEPLNVGEEYEALFTNIPSRHLDSDIKLLPVDMRYAVVNQSALTARKDKTINFELTPLPDTTMLRGTVFDHIGQRVPFAWITVSDGKAYAFSDHMGRFNIAVPGKEGEQVNLDIELKGRKQYEGKIPLPDPDPIILNLYRDTITVSENKISGDPSNSGQFDQ